MTDVILLDGGTGMELLNRSSNKSPRHWSAEYLATEPDLVRQVHADYIAAGARVITINAYSATFTRMALLAEEDQVPSMQAAACRLAREASDLAGVPGIAIAGCLPPLNGTYRPDRVRPYAVNLDEYRRLAEMQAPHVDFFRCETLSSAEEARAAATAACETGKPVWVAWTLRDDAPLLRSGETIAEATAALAGLPVKALLANCCPPESISAAMPDLAASGRWAGGYANGFTPIPADYRPGVTLAQLGRRRDLDAETYARLALGWIDQGGRIVGGCCETGPDHISRLHQELQTAGYALVSAARSWEEPEQHR